MEQHNTPFGEHNKEEYPPMHTAEHLVCGAIAGMLGCGRAFSTHIEKKKSKCDFRFGRNLTDEERAEIERTVNRQIASGAAVRTETMDAEAAARQYDLSRVPGRAGKVRIVHIGTFDSCPCVGAHVADTGEIPPVRIVSSDWADGVLRVRFKFDKR